MLFWRIYVTGNNKTYSSLQANCPNLLSHFKNNLHLFDRFSSRSLISTPTEVRREGDAPIHADRRKDRQKDTTKLTGAFRDYVNGPKNNITPKKNCLSLRITHVQLLNTEIFGGKKNLLKCSSLQNITCRLRNTIGISHTCNAAQNTTGKIGALERQIGKPLHKAAYCNWKTK